MNDTSLITTERFRMPVGGGWILGILGGAFVALAAAFVVVALRAPVLDQAQLYLAAFPFLVGLVMIGAAVQRSRFELTISPEGVRFIADGDLVPWAAIASFAPTSFRNELQVLDHSGHVVGVVPAAIDGFERAVLRLAQVITARPPAGPRTFVGHHGGWGWLLFLAAAVYMAQHFGFDRLPRIHGAQWIWLALFGFFMFAEIRQRWGRTGQVELTIDDLGIRFRGRSGDWAARWGEITEMLPGFRSPSRLGTMTIAIRTAGGGHHSLSVKEFELAEVLAALRAFGGIHWTRGFVPSAEAAPVSLLGRKFY